MSPTLHKIRQFRELEDRYAKLRGQIISQTTNDKNGYFHDYFNMNMANQGGEGFAEEDDWENLGEQTTGTETSDNGERRNATGKQGEATGEVMSKTATTEILATETVESLSRVGLEAEDVEMEWESTFFTSDEEEEDSDKSLGADVELSELLQLERENPDDFGLPALDEPPTRPTRPNNSEAPTFYNHLNDSHENVPSTQGTILPSIEYPYYDDDDVVEDDYPPDKFRKTEAFITITEWSLRKLLPYKHYRPKTPSRLRTCYTVIG
jgi:hypothetical protein